MLQKRVCGSSPCPRPKDHRQRPSATTIGNDHRQRPSATTIGNDHRQRPRWHRYSLWLLYRGLLGRRMPRSAIHHGGQPRPRHRGRGHGALWGRDCAAPPQSAVTKKKQGRRGRPCFRRGCAGCAGCAGAMLQLRLLLCGCAASAVRLRGCAAVHFSCKGELRGLCARG